MVLSMCCADWTRLDTAGDWTRMKQMMQEVVPEHCSSLDDYLAKMSEDESWGDGTMLMAASLCYQRQVIVYYPQAEQQCSRLSESFSDAGAIRLGFVGNNHYVSLIPSSHSSVAVPADPESVKNMENAQSMTYLMSITCSTRPLLLEVHADNQNFDNDGEFGDVLEASKLHCVRSQSVTDSSGAELDSIKPAHDEPSTVLAGGEEHAHNLKSKNLPTGISAKSWKIWTKSRSWLAVKNCKVICTLCSEIEKQGGVGVFKKERFRGEDAFVNGVIASRKKLLKKIEKHAASKSHATCAKIKKKSEKQKLKTAAKKAKTVWEEANEDKISATCKVFNVAYVCAMEELSYVKHSALMEVMQKNGMEKMNMLASDHACSDITTHIADIMRSALVQHINTGEYPFSIMVDESTTLSGKTALIIYVRIPVENEVCNLFFSLVELTSKATAANIANAIYQSLTESGVKHEILQLQMIGFASDGASVMRGENAGTVVHLKEILKSDFRSFHCMAHRLELAVNGAVKSSGEIQRLQMFTDSLYAFYSKSPKNMYELSGIADSLQTELFKITQIFTVRWVFSTYRAVGALVADYSSLCKHMEEVSNDTKRRAKERATCSGFAKKMTEWQFVAELLLLADTLEVLWYFSAFLQQQSASLIDVKHKLSVTTTTLFEMKKTAGTSLSKLLSATADQYDGVTLSRTS